MQSVRKRVRSCFFWFIILCWQPKIIVRPETQWELRKKKLQQRKEGLQKQDRGDCVVWVNLKRVDTIWTWIRLPCEKDWNGKYCVLSIVHYLDQPLLTQWDWKHRDGNCSLRSTGMALGKCHILLKLCPACKIPYFLKISAKKIGYSLYRSQRRAVGLGFIFSFALGKFPIDCGWQLHYRPKFLINHAENQVHKTWHPWRTLLFPQTQQVLSKSRRCQMGQTWPCCLWGGWVGSRDIFHWRRFFPQLEKSDIWKSVPLPEQVSCCFYEASV